MQSSHFSQVNLVTSWRMMGTKFKKNVEDTEQVCKGRGKSSHRGSSLQKLSWNNASTVKFFIQRTSSQTSFPPVLQDHASKNCSNRFQYLGTPTMSSSARSNLDATWWLQTGRFWAVNFSNILLGWNPTLISWILAEPVSCCFMGADIGSSSKECWKYQPTLLKATTLPKTNSAHLKMDGWDGWNTSFLFGVRPTFRGYV